MKNLMRRRRNRVVRAAACYVVESLESRRLLSVFVVTNTGDNGGVNPVPGAASGTLRQAIIDSDADTAGTNTIDFNIPSTDPGDSGGVFTIQTQGQLPTISQAVDIDGTSQSGYVAGSNPVIELLGQKSGDTGLDITASGSSVEALDIGDFGSAGVLIDGASNVSVTGSYIGVDPTGTKAIGNLTGIVIDNGASDSVIGGTTTGSRNVISGSISHNPNNFVGGNGVEIDGTSSGPQTTGNIVEGNYIGTDANGADPLGNSRGVLIDDGATDNIVGGTSDGSRNIIAGNTYSFGGGSGVEIDGTVSGPQTSQNVIEGNYIGTIVTGLIAQGNVNGVVIAAGATNNVIGGATAGAGNIISGNRQNGVEISASTENIVEGNYIGIDATGVHALGNDIGIIIMDGASSNIIGGDSAGARNVISGNIQSAVIVGSPNEPQSTDNTVAGNYIGTDATGQTALPNYAGVYLDFATDTTIGGTVAGSRNVISGNTENILINRANLNVIEGNFIGTDASGLQAILPPLGDTSNFAQGVGVVDNGSSYNVIGGTTPSARNVISDCQWMIALDFTIGDIVEGNYIGTDALGSTSLPGGEGVYLSAGASGNIVGGTAPGAGNVISCSSFADPSSDPFQTGGADEVVIYGNYYSPPGAANIVEGNFIGTDATGTKGIANDGAGVLIAADASGNVIGGTSPGSRNIISGNAGNGVEIDGTAIGTQNADANFVEGNYIGTDVTGLKALGNLNGVVIDDGASNNIIGGTEAGARNIISGNTGNGVEIDGTASGPQTSGNVVEGNYIGTDVTGLVAVGNLNGIVIDDGATDNTIGGATAGSRNVISGNSIGIRIEGTPSGPQTSENFVEGNYIGTDSSSLVAVGNGDGILITNAKHI